MRRAWRLLVVAGLALNAQASLFISVYTSGTNGSYAENFDTLSNTGNMSEPWADDSTLPGWYAHSSSPTLLGVYHATNGSRSTGGIYSYGAGGSTDRALGSIGDPNPLVSNLHYGVQFRNDTSVEALNFVLSVTGEQWRRGANATQRPESLTFWYQVSTVEILGPTQWATNHANWIQVSALTLTTPNATDSAALSLDGNVASNRVVLSNVGLSGLTVPAGQYVAFKWRDNDDAGTDHGLGLDNLSVTWTTEVPEPASLGLGLFAVVCARARRRRA